MSPWPIESSGRLGMMSILRMRNCTWHILIQSDGSITECICIYVHMMASNNNQRMLLYFRMNPVTG